MLNFKALVFAVVIAVVFPLAFGDEKTKYGAEDLFTKAKQICCPNKRRREELPVMEKNDASSFLKDEQLNKRFFLSGILPGIREECCGESRDCSQEEVLEVHNWSFVSLSNECITEGCYQEEIREDC